MDSDSNVEVGALLRGSVEVISSTPAGSVGYVVGLGALGSAMDLLNPESISNMPYTIASVFGGFLLLRAMLVNTGLAQAGESKRLGAYFGLSILSGLGIFLGLLLLVIPGVILVVMGLLGLVTSYTLGGLIHILIVLAVVVLAVRIIQGRRI